MTTVQPADASADRIDLDDPEAVNAWAAKLDVTSDQICEAVADVGELAADVEMHLKGTHSTTNAERVRQAGAL